MLVLKALLKGCKFVGATLVNAIFFYSFFLQDFLRRRYREAIFLLVANIACQSVTMGKCEFIERWLHKVHMDCNTVVCPSCCLHLLVFQS